MSTEQHPQRRDYPPDIDDQILTLQREGLRRDSIAEQLGINIHKVAKVLVKYGVKYTHEQRAVIAVGNRAKQIPDYPPGTTERILALRVQGVTRAEIARQLGVSIDKVHSDIIRSRSTPLPLEVRAAQHERYAPEVREEAIRLRQEGMKVNNIAIRVGADESAIQFWCARAGIKLTREQHNANMRDYPLDVDDKIIGLRLTGMDRNDIARELGVSFSKVKTLLGLRGVTIPMEQRAVNSYAKLGHAHMIRIRALVDEEKRALATRLAWQSPVLRRLRSEQSKAMWRRWTPEQRARPRGEESVAYRAMLRRHGVQSGDELMHQFAAKFGFKFLGTYRGMHTKTAWECKKNHQFMTIPQCIKYGHGCPRCAHTGPSKGQVELYDFVCKLLRGQEVELGNRRRISPKELDVYVPSLDLGIEYHGLYWHSSAMSHFKGGESREKFQACERAGAKLLVVFEDEWELRRPLIESVVARKLGVWPAEEVSAADLEPRLIRDADQYALFVAENHLDGDAPADFAWGLYRGDSLVACATFRRWGDRIELVRMCAARDLRVRGATARLLSLQPGPLKATSSDRWTNGAALGRCGFVEEQKRLPPGGWWTDGNNARVPDHMLPIRQSDPTVLEHFPTVREQAAAGLLSLDLFGNDRPLYRIEDCGHRRWRRPG